MKYVKKALWIALGICASFGLGLQLPRLYLFATTEPPYAYMVNDVREQAECARKAGFVFEPPRLRVMKPAYVWDRPHGYAHVWYNIILLAPYASYETIAHELGHTIDYQMARRGHPLFVQYHNSPALSQGVADAIKEEILKQCYASRRATTKPLKSP